MYECVYEACGALADGILKRLCTACVLCHTRHQDMLVEAAGHKHVQEAQDGTLQYTLPVYAARSQGREEAYWP